MGVCHKNNKNGIKDKIEKKENKPFTIPVLIFQCAAQLRDKWLNSLGDGEFDSGYKHFCLR